MRSDEPEVRELFRPLRRRWWLILIVGLVVGAATYMHYKNERSSYSATTSIFVGGNTLDAVLLGGGSGGASDRDVANQARLLLTRSVAERVAKRLKFQGDPARLLGQVTAIPNKDSDFVSINATAATDEAAVAIANGFASAFVELRSSELREDAAQTRRDIQRRRDALGGSLADDRLRRTLDSRLQTLRFIEAIPTGAARQVDRARIAQEIKPQPVRNALFGGVLGLILGGLLVVGLHMLDRRLRRGDVENEYQAPLLALLPDDRKAVDQSKQGAKLAEPLIEPVRRLRTALALSGENGVGPPRSILVTSAVPEEGKSTLTLGLATAYFEAGLRVLAIDADLRRPTLATSIGVQPQYGLTDVLLGTVELSQAVVVAPLETDTVPAALQRDQRLLTSPVGGGRGNGDSFTGESYSGSGPPLGPHLAVLGSGSHASDPAALFGTRRMAALLQEAQETYDMVLIDTAPLLAVSDAVPLLNQVSGVLLVTRFNYTRRDDAKRARLLIDRVPRARVLGVVANGATEEDSPYSSYSGAAP